MLQLDQLVSSNDTVHQDQDFLKLYQISTFIFIITLLIVFGLFVCENKKYQIVTFFLSFRYIFGTFHSPPPPPSKRLIYRFFFTDYVPLRYIILRKLNVLPEGGKGVSIYMTNNDEECMK